MLIWIRSGRLNAWVGHVGSALVEEGALQTAGQG
jgi:hypothetical protein